MYICPPTLVHGNTSGKPLSCILTNEWPAVNELNAGTFQRDRTTNVVLGSERGTACALVEGSVCGSCAAQRLGREWRVWLQCFVCVCWTLLLLFYSSSQSPLLGSLRGHQTLHNAECAWGFNYVPIPPHCVGSEFSFNDSPLRGELE